MKQVKKKNLHSDEKGMATLEAIPLLICFLVLIAHSFGFYGIIQTGILNSIAARTYAFETFRHRSNLYFFRENRLQGTVRSNYFSSNTRLHGVNAEDNPINAVQGSIATERQLAIGITVPDEGRTNASIHNQEVYKIQEGQQNTTVATSPVWIMVSYGICLNEKCGD